jgi:hypothetical protein
MARQQSAAALNPAADVLSRTVSIRPWSRYQAEPDAQDTHANSLAIVLAMSQDVQRIRVRNPGDINRVDPEWACRMAEPEEELDFHDAAPDRFENGVGKSYDGYRIAFVEGEGYVRFENDGSERPADPAEIFMFRNDITKAAKSDDGIRTYAEDKGIAWPG